MTEGIIAVEWDVPKHIHACYTTRVGGCSSEPYKSFNLAMHVGDRRECVAANRRCLRQAIGLPAEPVWLQQVHGTDIIEALPSNRLRRADGSFTAKPSAVCVVMTADCLPLLLYDHATDRVAAVHVGWRGLVRGVVESGLKKLNDRGGGIVAWLGPSIGFNHFEIGDEVKRQLESSAESTDAFRPSAKSGRWLANLEGLVYERLRVYGIRRIHSSGLCTYTQSELFFSYRRQPRCGRTASMIWKR